MLLGVWRFSVLSVLIFSVHSLSLQNDATVLPALIDSRLPPFESDECDPSSIPVMENFDMNKFSGAWFELSKSASGYIDVNDGMWRIQTTDNSSIFLFSGRDGNAHCIRPIKGKVYASDQPPGTLTLHYKTYSNHVEETIRVLFTDYVSIAVIYKCVHHVYHEKEVCHSAGLIGAIWTRERHVDLHVYESALPYLEMACVQKSILVPRNRIGPCKVDDFGFDIDDFPVPDFCYQPMDMGFCRGNLQRYYYNPKSRSCETFTYHGCGGNRNNFLSPLECQEKCLTVNAKDPVCTSISKCAIHCAPCCTEDRSGCVECNCEDVIEEYIPNCMKSPALCQPECTVEEYYLGCYICSCHNQINEPFIDDENDVPACLEVKSQGNCKDHIERYHYNAKTQECESFIYSGCDGNKNNFETMEQCHATCIGNIYEADVVKENPAANFKNNKWTTGSLLSLLLLFCLV